MSRNMMWDGLFHLVTWIVTLIGIFLGVGGVGFLLIGWLLMRSGTQST